MVIQTDGERYDVVVPDTVDLAERAPLVSTCSSDGEALHCVSAGALSGGYDPPAQNRALRVESKVFWVIANSRVYEQ